MADTFLQLDRVGNGYALRGGGRVKTNAAGTATEVVDALMFVHNYVLDSDDVDTTVLFVDYVAAVIGFSGNGVDVREMYMIKDTSSATWHVHSDAAAPLGAAALAKVLFISRALCVDEGETTQA